MSTPSLVQHTKLFWTKVFPYPSRLLLLNPNPNAVIDSMNQVLLRSEIAFGGLDRGMPEQQLNLLQFPARFPAQLRAGPSQVMWG